MLRFYQFVLSTLISLILFGLLLSPEQACAENPNETDAKDSAVLSPEEDPAYEPLRAKLTSPTSFEFKDAKLAEIAEVVSKKYGLQIKIDLTAKKFDPKTLITKKVTNLPLGTALGSMLREYKLHLSILDKETLSIDDRIPTVSVAYSIEDLLSLYDKDADGKKFAEMLQLLVQAKTWKKNGGEGICVYSTPNKILVIDNTEAVHEHVSDYIATLRRVNDIVR